MSLQSVKAHFTGLSTPRVSIQTSTKGRILTCDGHSYITAATMRASKTDSNVIPISYKAIENAVKHSNTPITNHAEIALVYGWADEDNNTHLVAMTIEQHQTLTTQGITVPNPRASKLFSITGQGEGVKYFLRRTDNAQQWAQLEDLARTGQILFASRQAAPVVTMPPLKRP